MHLTSLLLKRLQPLAAAVCVVSIIGAGAAAGQDCEGDCNRDSTVTINELIVAVRVALGDASLDDCRAIDRNNDGDVTINELIAAVTRALTSCAGSIDESAAVASARIAVEPIIRIIDLGSAAVGATGGIAAASQPMIGRTAGVSGCETFDCFLFGEFTGTEEVCCFEGQLTVSSDNCTFDDGAGNVISRSGVFAIFADDPSVCTGVLSPGVSYEAAQEGFVFSYQDVDGNFLAFTADLFETFDAVPSDCTDELGFGIAGDGTRTLDGIRREVVGDVFGSVVTDVSTEYSELQIDILSTSGSEGCNVGVQLNGGLASNDFTAGTAFDATFQNLQIVQVPLNGVLNIGVNGTIGTDCIGDVTLSTDVPLRLVPGDECATGGRIEAALGGGVVAAEYTSGGGINLDFGADGSIDQSFSSCDDAVSDDCNAEEVAGLCDACTASGQCSGDLDCFPCVVNCTGDTLRCSFTDTFATCEDGVF